VKNLGVKSGCSRQVEDGTGEENLVVFETRLGKHDQPQAEKDERKNHCGPPT